MVLGDRWAYENFESENVIADGNYVFIFDTRTICIPRID